MNRRHFITAAAAVFTPLSARAAEPIIVPMSLDAAGRPIVSVTVDGHGPFRFMLNTGSTINCFDWGLADSIGLKRVGKLHDSLFGNWTAGSGGDQDARSYRARELQFEGGYRLTDVAITGTPPINTTVAGPADRQGLLGGKFLTSVPCRIDYIMGQIAFYPDGGLPVSDMTETSYKDLVANDYEFDWIDIGLTAAGNTLPAVMSTVGRFDLYLSSALVARMGSYDSMTPSSYADVPVDIAHPEGWTVRVRQWRDVKIGGVVFNRLTVAYGDPRVPDGLESTNVFVLAGAPLLRQFDIAFDGKGGVYMKPNVAFSPSSDLPSWPAK